MEAAQTPALPGFEELVGGVTATGKRLTVIGVKLEDVPDDLKKGQLVKIEVTARVGDLGWEDKIDSKTGDPVDCTQKYRARCLSARVIGTPADLKSVE